MSKSTINPNKKSRGRPPVDSEQFGIRLERDQIDALEAFRAEHPDLKTKPAAIRRIIRDWLVGHGYLDSHKE